MAKGGLTPLLLLLQLIRIAGILAGLALGTAFTLLVVRLIGAWIDGVRFKDLWFLLFLSLYGVLFCVMMILCELRWNTFFGDFSSFIRWSTRGLFYFFLGMFSFNIGVSAAGFGTFLDGDAFARFLDIMAYTVMAIGALYVVMEIFCCRSSAQGDANRTNKFPDVV